MNSFACKKKNQKSTVKIFSICWKVRHQLYSQMFYCDRTKLSTKCDSDKKVPSMSIQSKEIGPLRQHWLWKGNVSPDMTCSEKCVIKLNYQSLGYRRKVGEMPPLTFSGLNCHGHLKKKKKQLHQERLLKLKRTFLMCNQLHISTS